ncbi:MAG TPA: aminopeptidase P family N-terminal domain-containing protein [Micropepsaceae bacterium]|nr:aminopeptidase P family N-terminal domain-containing protein [Micropepsaceae bacterium]
MRRGLMAWDAEEIPVEALHERTRRLLAEMVNADQDAIILYTNFIRSAAVSYLTAFSPYWADGVLLVPREGEPVFATTLSKRVGEWIQTVKPVGGLLTSPTPAKVLGEILAEKKARRVSILELDAFPSGLYQELVGAAPGVEIVDGTDVFAKARVIDDVERRLMKRADAIARGALDGIFVMRAETAGEIVGAVEKAARMMGTEEVYVAIASNLDSDRRFARVSGPKPLGSRYAVRATVAYKGVWSRSIKTSSQSKEDRISIGRADIWFEALLAALDPGRPLDEQIATALPVGAKFAGWTAEGPVGTRPLAASASSSAPVVGVSLDIGGMPWCGAGLAQRRA